MLDEKQDGFYVEIGAFESKKTNNTYLLETEFNWTGVAFEWLEEPAKNYNQYRKNPCIKADATTFDYLGYFVSNNFPKQIDYLQVDIDPPRDTLNSLKKLPLDEYRFSTITFEHDLYAGNQDVKEEQKELLSSLGYVLAFENVKVYVPGYPDREFEDWWIDPAVVAEEKYLGVSPFGPL
jgi:hypothetical protein